MGKKRSSKITLSYPKLEGLITKANYTIHKLYTEEDHITFVLCKSPKFQKSFVVYIPSKFKLIPPKKGLIERVDITKTPSSEVTLSQRQLSYLSDVTSNDANSIISISNKTLVLHTPKLTEHYIISGEEDENEVDEEDSDEVLNLEKNTKRLERAINKLSKTAGVPTSKDKSKDKKVSKEEKKPSLEKEKKDNNKNTSADTTGDNNEDDSEDTTGDNEEADSVEDNEDNNKDDDETEEESEATEEENPNKITLVFDDGGDDDVDSEALEEALSSEEEEEEEEDSSIESTGETGDNSFPQDMLERDVVIGVIYVLIDISSFLKSISFFEETLLSQYSQIDENEFELKKARLARIKDAFDIVYEAANATLVAKHEEEKTIKTQIVRSTILLLQIQSLKNKIKENPSKYSDVNSEVQETLDQTIKTISNMNLEIMELRDEIDEMLTNFAAVVSDLEGVVRV